MSGVCPGFSNQFNEVLEHDAVTATSNFEFSRSAE